MLRIQGEFHDLTILYHYHESCSRPQAFLHFLKYTNFFLSQAIIHSPGNSPHLQSTSTTHCLNIFLIHQNLAIPLISQGSHPRFFLLSEVIKTLCSLAL